MIIEALEGFVVYNTKKPFQKGHTHLNNFNAAVSAVKLVEHRELPRNRSKYFIESLVRISLDKEYIDKVCKAEKEKKQAEQSKVIGNVSRRAGREMGK